MSEEVETKRRGRPRKYATDQDRINAIAKKQCEEKKLLTKIRHILRDEHHDSQLFLLELLSKQVINDRIANAMKAVYE